MNHQQLAYKKLRSFALFPSQKRNKYESAYELFGKAVDEYEQLHEYILMGDMLAQQARICINKLSNPVQSAVHYMEAARAYMSCNEYNKAIEVIQLAVQSRAKPTKKHQEKPYLTLPNVSLADGYAFYSPADSNNNNRLQVLISSPPSLRSTKSTPASSHSKTFNINSNSHPSNSITPISTRRLLLTPQAMKAQISDTTLSLPKFELEPAVLSIHHNQSIQDNHQLSFNSNNNNNNNNTIHFRSLSGNSSTSTSTSSTTSSSPTTIGSCSSSFKSSSSTSSSPLTSRTRRHSISTSTIDPNVNASFILQPLHIDLLLARLAVQLGTDLWTDLDWRDAIFSLEIACSLFDSLLQAEKNQNMSFRKPTYNNGDNNNNPAFTRAFSDPQPSSLSSSSPSPSGSVSMSPPSSSHHTTTTYDHLVSGLLKSQTGSTHSLYANISNNNKPMSQTVTFSNRPNSTSLPIPSFVQPALDKDIIPVIQIKHIASPLLTVYEGEHLHHPYDTQPSITILEESLVCKFQLANYYVSWDEELGNNNIQYDEGYTLKSNIIDNQELRRAKALYESIAAVKPDWHLLHTCLYAHLRSIFNTNHLSQQENIGVATASNVDIISGIIAEYAADDDKLVNCLFLAGLCDALIHIRVYASKHSKKPNVQLSKSLDFNKHTSSAVKKALKNVSPKAKAASSLSSSLSDSISTSSSPFETSRVVECPSILKRYREMCVSLTGTPEICLLRQVYGLLHLAASLTLRIDEVFGVAPHVAKQLFQAAWGADILNEFTACTGVFAKQRPISNIASKLLIQIKAQVRAHIR